MAKKQILDIYGELIRTVLGKDTDFEGEMVFDRSIKIDGRFAGRIKSNSSLYIEEGAVVNADVQVRSMIISGEVHGNIFAHDRLEMLPSAKIYGNVKTSRLRISDGVLFEGKCEMIKDPEMIDVFVSDVEKLKKTLVDDHSAS